MDDSKVTGDPQFAMTPLTFLESDAPSGARATYTALASFAARGRDGAHPSQEAIAKRAGLGLRMVQKWLVWLDENGWIVRTVITDRKGRTLGTEYDLSPAWGVRAGANGGSPPGGELDRPSGANGSSPNQTSEQTTKDQTNKNSDSEIEAVFLYWVESLSKWHGNTSRLRLTKPRRDAIRARLRDGYSLDDLRRAVDGVVGSKWHRDNGHTDLTLILRPQKIDSHILRAQSADQHEAESSANRADRLRHLADVAQMVKTERSR